jgi:hypothetical protein
MEVSYLENDGYYLADDSEKTQKCAYIYRNMGPWKLT